MSDTSQQERADRTAVDKAIDILKAFGKDASCGLGVSELSRRAGLSKSTAFRVLGILERNGVVERAGTAYRLGLVLSEMARPSDTGRHDAVRETLTPFLTELYMATNATVQLAILSGSHVTYLNKLEGAARLRTPSRIGGRMPAYCTAVGKVLLAADADALEQVLDAPRPAWTSHTIVDANQLLVELERVRTSGIAIDRGESLESLACIAAPIRNAGGRVVAALSVSGEATVFRPKHHEGALRVVAHSASRIIAARGSASRAA